MRELDPKAIGIHFGNDQLRIEVVDDPVNGAHHHYRIFCPLDTDWHRWRVDLIFQSRPVKQVGCNGITNEALLAVVADRLRGFQEGPLATHYNAMALLMIEEAAYWLNARTEDRVTRGVEGTTVL
jgi:hypothetical protein